MIKPTIGRVMWYWPHKDDREDQPLACLVTYVHDDNMVNLVVFDMGGFPMGEQSVPIVQDGSPHSVGVNPYCEWMPYQKGQAAKAEAAEKALAEKS